MAADPDRNRPARGCGPAGECIEAEELAGVRGTFVAPARTHHPDRFVAPRAAPVVGRAEGLDLLAHPADAGAKDHATRREVIECGEHLGGEERVAMRQHEHGGAEGDAFGHTGHQCERRQRLEKIRGRW